MNLSNLIIKCEDLEERSKVFEELDFLGFGHEGPDMHYLEVEIYSDKTYATANGSYNEFKKISYDSFMREAKKYRSLQKMIVDFKSDQKSKLTELEKVIDEWGCASIEELAESKYLLENTLNSCIDEFKKGIEGFR